MFVPRAAELSLPPTLLVEAASLERRRLAAAAEALRLPGRWPAQEPALEPLHHVTRRREAAIRDQTHRAATLVARVPPRVRLAVQALAASQQAEAEPEELAVVETIPRR
jgi:hypothetical protein